MPILVFERGDKKGKSLKLDVGKRYVFGRDPGNHITLTDPLTSRRHFEIRADGTNFRLIDMESTNGTFLNDEQVDSALLKVGDKIQAGDTIVSFLSDQKEETAQGLVGKTIGGYKILERVGRGGMGTVYKANQLSLNRIVALKVLSARLLKDETFIERFKSEARSAGQLNHPNIVGVYDVGTDGGLHFFSMEFMDGGSVQDELGRDGKLGWEDALDLLIQASRALEFAERKEIIHRDVKPDNLMRTSDGQLKLADLGLARKANGDHTAEQGIFGTPHFISPEQAQGKELDHRADLYSLGASAYRLLGGRTPFLGSNIKEIITQQITAEPPSLTQFAPDAPIELIAVVEKLMKKAPDDRYPNATALHADLEKIRLKYHLKVTGGSGGGKGALIAVGIAVVAVIAVLAFALSQGGGSNGNGTQVVTPPPVKTTQIVEPVPNGANDAEVREAKAEIAFLNLGRQEVNLGALAETALTRQKDWEAIAADYDKIAGSEDFAETKAAEKALSRAEKIRTTIREFKAREKESREKAEKFWNGVRSAVNELLEKKRFAAALEKVKAADQDEQMALVRQYLPDATETIETWQSTSRGSIADRFLTAWNEVRREADDLRKDADFVGASAAVKQFLASGVAGATGSPFDAVVEEAKELRTALKNEYREFLRQQLTADRMLYFSTHLGVRHHADSEDLGPANPVFDFAFATAAQTFEALLSGEEGGLKTDIYQAVARRKVSDYQRMDGLMKTLVDRLNENKLLVDELRLPEELEPGRGVNVEFDRKHELVATATELHYRRIIERRGVKADSAETLEWKAFTPVQFWESIFLKGGRFAMSPENFAAAALMLAEFGIADGVEDLISEAGDALTPAQRERLRFELSAIRAWDDVIDVMENRPPDQWSVAVQNFVANYSRSDWFILVYGFRRPGQGKSIVPEERENLWLDGRLEELDSIPSLFPS